MKKNNLFILIIFTSLIYGGCIFNKNSEPNQDIEIKSDSTAVYVRYENAYYSIPSYQMICGLMKGMGVQYDKKYLNSIENVVYYNSSVKKSVNLGIYIADIGYQNLFAQNKEIPEYLKVVQELSSDLNLDEGIDKNILENIERNINRRDPLLTSISYLFSNYSSYVNEKSNKEIGILILPGGYIESLYILTHAYLASNHSGLGDLIMQQQYVLDNIVKSLAPYYKYSSEYTALIDALVDLNYEYEILDYKYSYSNPAYTVEQGVIKVHNITKTEITMEEIDNIVTKIKLLRNSLIS